MYRLRSLKHRFRIHMDSFASIQLYLIILIIICFYVFIDSQKNCATNYFISSLHLSFNSTETNWSNIHVQLVKTNKLYFLIWFIWLSINLLCDILAWSLMYHILCFLLLRILLMMCYCTKDINVCTIKLNIVADSLIFYSRNFK